MSAIVYNSLTV